MPCPVLQSLISEMPCFGCLKQTADQKPWLAQQSNISCRCRTLPCKAGGGSTCSLLLQRHHSQPPSSSPGWSVTVPAGWVGVLWHELSFCGGHAAGQREWSWAQQQLGRPLFPQDYPTCAAGTAVARELSQQQAAEHAKRPPGKAGPCPAAAAHL